MRAGNLEHKITFYKKTIARDDYGASTDDWNTKAFDTKGEVRHVGGNKTLYNEEKFYARSIQLTVRYRPNVDETMQLTIDDEPTRYIITYMEELGRREGLRFSIEKINL